MAAESQIYVGITIGAAFAGLKAFSMTQNAIGKLDGAIQKLKAAKINVGADSSQLKALDKQIKITTAAITTLQTRAKSISLWEGKKNDYGEKLQKSWRAGAAAAVSLAVPVKLAIDYESAMADVKKVVNFEGEEDFNAFRKEILQMSRSIPLSAEELATITASGGQLGIAKENLLGFTETVAKMSTAFDMGAGEAGDSIAKLMNVYGLGLDQVGSLGDAINHMSDNSAAKANAVVEVLGRIGGSAKVFGLSS